MTNNKVRVLHILDELNTGGAERIVFSYFQNIDREKFQWDFVMTRYSNPQKRGLLESRIESMGGKIYRVHRKRENYLKNILDIDQIIKKGNYDIIHSHLDELSTFYLLSAKRWGVPVRICHSHLAGTDRGRGVEILCKALRPLMNLVTTDKFACGNDAGIALWGESSLKSGSVHIMKNAINTTDFEYVEETRQYIRTILEIDSDSVVIGSVGRLSYQKNSDFIIDIFAEIYKKNKKAVLVLVGIGDLLDKINQKVKQYGLEKVVKLLGSRDDVNKIMMAMDIFLLPSRFEGLPIVLVEAQCSGLSCFVSDTVTKEIKLSDMVKYISLKRKASDWANIILGNKSTIQRKMGVEMVIENGYDITSAAKELSDYYIEAIRNRHENNI